MKLTDIKNVEAKRDHGNIAELKQSIADIGLINPLTVDDNGNLLAGRRRYQAVKELGLEEVPVMIVSVNGDRLKSFRIALDENLKRKPLSDPENRAAIAQYDELKREMEGSTKGGTRTDLGYTVPEVGWNHQKTAQDLGISRESVGKAIQAEEIVKIHPELSKKSTNEILNITKKKNKEKANLIALTQAEQNQITLKYGDFRELIKDIPDNSIDLILTDPPYSKKYLPLWEDLSRESARVLKPGSFFIAYSGQYYLVSVLNTLAKHLEYYWLGMLYHKGTIGQRFEVNMWNRAKPILFFYKPPKTKQQHWLEDVLESPQAEKEHHDWGQSIAPFKKLIECFSLPGQCVLEPFAGGGSVILACIEAKRSVVAYENDKITYENLARRLGYDKKETR